MADKLTIIYHARTVHDANMLKMVLGDEGIQAAVTNQVLESGSAVGATGVAFASVVVNEVDVAAARPIVLEFDRQASARVGASEETAPSAEEPPDVVHQWPECPDCDARRITKCPICHTSGTDFVEADPDYLGIPDLPESAPASSGCGGSCGCGSAPAASNVDQASAEEETATVAREEEAEPESVPYTLMCSICDEPFVPEYPCRCEWCGHQFDDGYPVDVNLIAREPISTRAVAVGAGLLALLIVFVIYFMVIL